MHRDTYKNLAFFIDHFTMVFYDKQRTPNRHDELNDINDRIQILEEKFEYQERTIDALNDVIIEQQTQINAT